MPRAKALPSYPNAQFAPLWLAVSRTGKPVTVPLERTKALTLRAQFYAWRRVALANEALAIQCGIDVQSLHDVRMQVVEDGLRLFHKDDAVGVAEIEGVLATLGPIPDAPQVQVVLSQESIDAIFDPDAVMKRLQGLQEGES